MSRLFERFIRAGDELGVTTRREFAIGPARDMIGPPLAREAFEWMALLDAVEDSSGMFTMLELGAGFGRWTVRAAAAVRRYRPNLRYRLVAVEAEPTHFEWLRAHVEDNHVGSDGAGTCHCVNAAVSAAAGEDDFYYGDPAAWYGQALLRSENAGADAPVRRVKTITLSQLLESADAVDLIDLDIQGAELEVLREASALLRRVRRVSVETHSSKIDDELPETFAGAEGSWSLIAQAPLGARLRTPVGNANFEGGGIQVWHNVERVVAQTS